MLRIHLARSAIVGYRRLVSTSGTARPRFHVERAADPTCREIVSPLRLATETHKAMAAKSQTEQKSTVYTVGKKPL